MFRRVSLPLALALAATTACSDAPTPPVMDADAPAPVQSVVPGQITDVPAVDFDLPLEPRPWDTSAVALEEAVAAEDGHAVIGFKAPGLARAITTGRRAAVPATTIQQALDLLEERDVSVLEFYWLIGGAHVQLPPGAASALREHPLIDYIEPRQRWTVQGVRGPSGGAAVAPFLAQTTPWGVSMVRAPQAWSVATGAGAKVQIIDTGHDRGHEDLPLVPFANCTGPFDGCSDGVQPHGTHVLGSLTARDNTWGVVGVAPGVAPSDVFTYAACDPNPPFGCNTDAIIAGIQASTGVDVLSMSLGGEFDFGGSNAVAQAWADGVVLVAAVGNRQEGTTPPANFYPAAYTNVLGVSGVKEDGTFAASSPCPHPAGGTVASNYGSYVAIAAPFWALSTVTNNSYGGAPPWCGTSMATPHVAAAAALVRQQNPGWSNQQIVDRLLGSAAPDCGGDFCGSGILDAASAMMDPPNVVIQGPLAVSSAGSYQWVANASGGTGTYSYHWEWSPANESTWYFVSSQQSYTTFVSEADEPYFNLRVTITSGQAQDVASRRVIVDIGGGCHPPDPCR